MKKKKKGHQSFFILPKCFQSQLKRFDFIQTSFSQSFACGQCRPSNEQTGSINVYVFRRMSAAFCFPPPACWLYPLKPGRERKAEDVQRKTFMLIYPDP
jgi:hypothetical protein